jgi:ribose transport system substrate-binding protein
VALTGPKKIDGFICLDSASGKMVSDALKRAGGGRELIAWDVNQDTLDEIKAGTIDATIAQKPFTMGYVGLKALDEVFHAPPKALDKDYSADSFSPYPGVCGYRHVAGGQEQCGLVHCRSGGAREVDSRN